jgi:Zn-dependent peptidase ImmA (M78 family)
MKDRDVYGLSGFSPQYGPCILLNAVNTVERRIFSLAHEYGHLLMHRSFYRSKEPASGLPKDHDLEQMANVFAANFLVPDVALKIAFQRSIGDKPVGIEDVVFLKRYFKVSADMMIRRLKDLGLLDANSADSLMTEVNRRRPDPTQEIAPLQSDMFGEWKRLNRFDHLARKAALDNLVSLGKLAELLGLNIVEARKRVQEWRRDVSAA